MIEPRTLPWILVALVVSLGSVYLIDLLSTSVSSKDKQEGSSGDDEVEQWIQLNELQDLVGFFRRKGQGVISLVSLAQLEESPDLDALAPPDKERLKRATTILKQRLILKLYLEDHRLIDYYHKLTKQGVNTLEDVYWFEEVQKLELPTKLVPMWNLARESLPTELTGLENLKERLWNRIVNHYGYTQWGTMLLVTLSIGGFATLAKFFPQKLSSAKDAIMEYISSSKLHCKVDFHWKEPAIVGNTLSFHIKFFQGSHPYPVTTSDNILIEISQNSQKVSTVTEFSEDEPNLLIVKFSVRKSGEYKLNILVDNNHIRGSPFKKMFLPASIDPNKALVKGNNTVVCVSDQPHRISILAKDQYGNLCKDYDEKMFQFQYQMISSLPPNTKVPAACLTQFDRVENLTNLSLRFANHGVYSGELSYDSKPIQNGKLDLIVLSSAEASSVVKNVSVKNSSNFYEGRVISIGSDVSNKVRKVYVYVNNKQLIVKEFFLKVVPIRMASFRISPNTKLTYSQSNEEIMLKIDDGSQPAIKLAIKDAKIVIATFNHFLLRNIGGSETFQDKQDHFFKELRDLHRKQSRDKVALKIQRDEIIQSTWKGTKNMSSSDWCKNFDISFNNEQGLDWGGVRREWFTLLSTRLFESNPIGMFISFGESRLVHPNPNSRWKPKHFEMAGRIVGKCLFESSLGSSYRQMVKAKFNRSFLAQIIGLRVNYKHFEQDEPELYLRKVKFILENDVDSMELTFVEEEYDPLGKLIKTVDLIPLGSKTLVTNANKKEYLNALAEYRLAFKVKNQVDSFIKGLNELVPDELLSIFDENELELLMCGNSTYNVLDLRSHHTVPLTTPEFSKTLDYFWTAVGNMTEEEKGRLLQFSTGCSQLPPGGFKELSPLFQLSPMHGYNSLPTAHTCFNQLCLPQYDDYETFDKFLRIAINEGSEGFCLI